MCKNFRPLLTILENTDRPGVFKSTLRRLERSLTPGAKPILNALSRRLRPGRRSELDNKIVSYLLRHRDERILVPCFGSYYLFGPETKLHRRMKRSLPRLKDSPELRRVFRRSLPTYNQGMKRAFEFMAADISSPAVRKLLLQILDGMLYFEWDNASEGTKEAVDSTLYAAVQYPAVRRHVAALIKERGWYGCSPAVIRKSLKLDKSTRTREALISAMKDGWVEAAKLLSEVVHHAEVRTALFEELDSHRDMAMAAATSLMEACEVTEVWNRLLEASRELSDSTAAGRALRTKPSVRKRLVKLLRSTDNSYLRDNLSRILVHQLENRAVRSAFMHVLKTGSESTVRDLLYVLEKASCRDFDDRFARQLLSLLHDERAIVREVAARLLGRFTYACLTDDVREHAAQVGFAKMLRAEFPRISTPEIRLRLAEVMCPARDREDALPFVLRVLEDPDAAVRASAFRFVEELEPTEPLETALRKALCDESKELRIAAARALGRGDSLSTASKSALLKALEDPDSSVRLHALRGLERAMRQKAVQKAAVKALSDGNEEVRNQAARLLDSTSLSLDEMLALDNE